MLSSFTKAKIAAARDRTLTPAAVHWHSMTRTSSGSGTSKTFAKVLDGASCRFRALTPKEVTELGWKTGSERYYVVAFASLAELQPADRDSGPFAPKPNDEVEVVSTGARFIVKAVQNDPLGEASELMVYVSTTEAVVA